MAVERENPEAKAAVRQRFKVWWHGEAMVSANAEGIDSGKFSEKSNGGPTSVAKIPFRMRLKAWWDGYDLSLRIKEKAAKSHDVSYQTPKPDWETAQIAALQEIWGSGFSGPGGADYILHLIKPFGLNLKMSVLDLGAGLGGPARVMNDKFSVWVTGLETERAFAEAGMELSTMAGVAKKAPISVFDADQFEGKPGSYDCIFSQEFLYKLQDKDRMLSTLSAMLKDKGQLLFTDYVLAKKGKITPTVKMWMDLERQKPWLWSMADYDLALLKVPLDVRISEDITDSVREVIVKGWADYLSSAKRGGIDDELAEALIEQVELWTRKVEAIDAGDLKVCRVHAFKKGITGSMS